MAMVQRMNCGQGEQRQVCQRPQSRFVKSPAGAQREMLIKAALLLRRQVITARDEEQKVG